MRMDVNGDGTLTKREMLASDEFTAEEIEAIFELGDVDGDGEIDMGEFVGIFSFTCSCLPGSSFHILNFIETIL